MIENQEIRKYCDEFGKDYDMVVADAFRVFLAVEKPRAILSVILSSPEFFEDIQAVEKVCKERIYNGVLSVQIDKSRMNDFCILGKVQE